MNSAVLDFYRTHSAITDPGQYAPLFDALPDDVPGLMYAVQGLLLGHFAFHLYGVKSGEIDDAGFGVRAIEAMIARILKIQDAPLTQPREPNKRLGANCRNFATLLVSMLRHKGIPARERIGFEYYFGGKINYEHRITEYWNTAQQRWVLIDAQLDDRRRKADKITVDPLNIPVGGGFYISGDVWLKARRKALDPNQFGDSETEVGMPLIRYALLHDFDALNKFEVLGCDAWGQLIDQPESDLTAQDLEFLDEVATVTADPDAHFDALGTLHAQSAYGQQVRTAAQKSLKLAE